MALFIISKAASKSWVLVLVTIYGGDNAINPYDSLNYALLLILNLVYTESSDK